MNRKMKKRIKNKKNKNNKKNQIKNILLLKMENHSKKMKMNLVIII